MENAVAKSFELMLMGMVGIFVVLILIYFVICLLNKITSNKSAAKTDTKATEKEDEKAESVPAADNTEEEIVCAIVESVICEELHVEPDKIQIIEINEK